MSDSDFFFLVPEGNGYHFPRLPEPARPGPCEPERPGMSILERDLIRRRAMTTSDAIHDQVAQAFLNWRPSDVDRFNGTSWANLVSLVIDDGTIDGDAKIDVSHGQRMIAAQLLLKALNAAAVRRRGDILGRLREKLGYYASDPVEFYKSYPLPPAVPPTSTGLFHGVRVSTAGHDEAHLARHEVLAALVLAAYERDPNWKPTETEMLAMMQRVGIK